MRTPVQESGQTECIQFNPLPPLTQTSLETKTDILGVKTSKGGITSKTGHYRPFLGFASSTNRADEHVTVVKELGKLRLKKKEKIFLRRS